MFLLYLFIFLKASASSSSGCSRWGLCRCWLVSTVLSLAVCLQHAKLQPQYWIRLLGENSPGFLAIQPEALDPKADSCAAVQRQVHLQREGKMKMMILWFVMPGPMLPLLLGALPCLFT